jgi:glycosyltransferase involved in cell wall biosynthesis
MIPKVKIIKIIKNIFDTIILSTKLSNFDIKISVIIPTYNRGNLIGNSITSVLNQTYKNLEIIIVDDGSTDNTLNEINKIKDERVRYIKLMENTGGSNARNVGIRNATGKYISFQDSDDTFYPEKLEKQINNIINKKSYLDFCKIKVIMNSSYFYFIPNPSQEKNITNGNIFTELISRGNFISTQAIVAKKNFIEKFYFDSNLPRLQDYDLILRMIPKVKISYTREVLVNLNIQKDSIQNSKEKLKKAIYILLNKRFDFNTKQKEQFSNYLNHLLKVYF